MNPSKILLKDVSKEIFQALNNPSDPCNGKELLVTMSLTTWKKFREILARSSTPCFTQNMPNKRHRDKITFSVTMPRDLHLQLKKLAERENTTVTKLVNRWAFEETEDISLTAEDHEQIAREIREWEKR